MEAQDAEAAASERRQVAKRPFPSAPKFKDHYPPSLCPTKLVMSGGLSVVGHRGALTPKMVLQC